MFFSNCSSNLEPKTNPIFYVLGPWLNAAE